MATNWKSLPDTSTPIIPENLIKDQVAVGSTQPTGNQDVWLDTANSKIKYKDNGSYTELNVGSDNYNNLTNKPQINSVELDGNKTLDNIGVPPKSHASSTNTYGVGTTSNYGHNKVINDLTHSSFANGESLSAYQGYVLNQKFNYSTSEVEIGKWRDSKTLYRKNYVITNIEITVGNWITLANVSNLNIDTLVDCRLYNNKMVWSGFLTRINNDNLQVINGMRDGMSWPCSEFIIEYTKSS